MANLKDGCMGGEVWEGRDVEMNGIKKGWEGWTVNLQTDICYIITDVFALTDNGEQHHWNVCHHC